MNTVALDSRSVAAPSGQVTWLGDVTSVRPRTAPTTASLRRLAAVALIAALAATVAIVLLGSVAAEPVAERVDGHVMVEPGRSLWEVAVETAPAGVDPARQLDAIQQINGVRSLEVDTWTIVLLPAHDTVAAG